MTAFRETRETGLALDSSHTYPPEKACPSSDRLCSSCLLLHMKGQEVAVVAHHGWRAAWNSGSARRSTMSKSCGCITIEQLLSRGGCTAAATAGDTALLVSCRHEQLATSARPELSMFRGSTANCCIPWYTVVNRCSPDYHPLLFHVEKQEPSFSHDDVETCQISQHLPPAKIQS